MSKKAPAWVEWSKNPEYPEKRDTCEFCGHRDQVKLSFDRIRFICINASACVLRWRKERGTA